MELPDVRLVKADRLAELQRAEAPGTMGRRDIEGMSDVRLALLWASDQIDKED